MSAVFRPSRFSQVARRNPVARRNGETPYAYPDAEHVVATTRMNQFEVFADGTIAVHSANGVFVAGVPGTREWDHYMAEIREEAGAETNAEIASLLRFQKVSSLASALGLGPSPYPVLVAGSILSALSVVGLAVLWRRR